MNSRSLHAHRVRDEFRERCEKKLKKFDRFFGENADAVVTVSNQNGRETVEVTTRRGMLFRQENDLHRWIPWKRYPMR
jgi:ribosome-associated translation inhibitor RaiA